MTETEQLILAKLDLLAAKLDLLTSARPQTPTLPERTTPPEVEAALTRAGMGLPRDVRIRMRSVALSRVQSGAPIDEVVRAIEAGEGQSERELVSLIRSL